MRVLREPSSWGRSIERRESAGLHRSLIERRRGSRVAAYGDLALAAVEAKDANAAAALCADGIEIFLPGADAPLRGRDGVRQMIRMSPEFKHSFREAEERDGEVLLTSLTRAPGVFANYTTWRFRISDDGVQRLSFDMRAAN